MTYLNFDTQYELFERNKSSDIYVDKSLLIDQIVKRIGTRDQYISITRPRRFGKSINANMLGAYFTKGFDSHRIFDDLKIAKTENYEEHMNKYNVIHIDFSRTPDWCESYKDYFLNIVNRLKQDIIQYYSLSETYMNFSIYDLLTFTKEKFIFILDEWDSCFYKDFITDKDKKHFLGFLKNLLKDQPYVELAYMTGVLPIAKYSSGSELNMFESYDFMNDNVFDAYFGFNEDEVKALCEQYKTISYDEMKQWYDGYYTSAGKSLFNPRSVTNALMRGVCLNYWTETGPMNEIADCIEHNVDEVREDIVKMVSGIDVEVQLDGYSAAELQLNTRDEILSAMVVFGFLSYYNGCLKIPNHELMEKFQKVLSRNSMGAIKDIVNQSRKIVEATLSQDAKVVAEIMETVHDREIPFLQYNDENSLSCVITLCYLYARKDYWIEREMKSGKGFCDYLFIPKKVGKPAIILELKVDKSCEDAIKQIKEKNYIQKVKDCERVLLVGINYDKVLKKHQCLIEAITTI